MANRVLVTWIGHTDLWAFAREDASSDRSAVEKIASARDGETGAGPVKALIDFETFDEVHLLSDYPPEITKSYGKWLGCKCKLHRLSPKNPSDHGEVLQLVRPVLESLKLTKEDSLNFHLSPGTPASLARPTSIRVFVWAKGSLSVTSPGEGMFASFAMRLCKLVLWPRPTCLSQRTSQLRSPKCRGKSVQASTICHLDNYLGDIQRRFLTGAMAKRGRKKEGRLARRI
jgi:hypothetical protein